MTGPWHDCPDTDLVAQARSGSGAAFAALYDRHAPGLARTLASFAGPDQATLDDLLQEVFLRVVRSLDTYVPERPFAHWLYTVALNVGRNHARQARRQVATDPGDLADLADRARRADLATAPDPLLAAALMRQVAALPPGLREVVSLRVGADLSYAEIGGLLGIPEGTARRRMHDALQRLRAGRASAAAPAAAASASPERRRP